MIGQPHSRRTLATLILLVPFAAGCGGGGGGGDKTGCQDSGLLFVLTVGLCAFGEPVESPDEGSDTDGQSFGFASNADPSFTSRSASTAPENQTGTGYTARVRDPDGDRVTFRLASGADQDAFSIDPGSGTLAFKTAPDFESPTDSDGRNDYIVDVKATDGQGGSTTQTVTVSVTDIDGFSATVAPGDDPRELEFSWIHNGAPAAFRLEVNPDGASGYTLADINGDGVADMRDRIDGSATSFDLTIPVHLTDFTNVLYQVVALDTDGNELDRSEEELSLMDLSTEELVGYFKSSNTESGDVFGTSVALSGDGTTLAVGAPGEDSAATSANGDGGDNRANGSGAVYVFVHDDAGGWSQQVYLKASNAHDSIEFGDSFGKAVALSANGSTLVVGAPGEDSAATGIDGAQLDDCSEINSSNCARDSGAAYVFARDSSGVWSQQAYVKASNTQAGDAFGKSIALADSATLAVGAPHQGSRAGTVYVFARDGLGTWIQQARLQASNREACDYFGTSLAVSGNGDMLAVGAHNLGSCLNTEGRGTVYTFTRDDSGAWSQQDHFRDLYTDFSDKFGASVALSAAGDTLAVGDPREDSAATGIDGDVSDNSADSAGAAYVFTVDDSGSWSRQAYIKASNTGVRDNFGGDVALSDAGDTLAVGALDEASTATGINGDESDNSASGAGAVYVFTRDAFGSWSQQSYVKASNTQLRVELGDRFASSVSLSGNGETLAVGASGEDSAATGIDGDQGDNSAENAGAVYLY